MANYEQGSIGTTIADSTPWWPPPVRPPGAKTNVLLVLLDDVGFSDFGCYGSEIDTPTIDRLAAEGLRYTGPCGPLARSGRLMRGRMLAPLGPR